MGVPLLDSAIAFLWDPLIVVVVIAVGLWVYGLVRARSFGKQIRGLASSVRWAAIGAVALLPLVSLFYLLGAAVVYSDWCDSRGVSPLFVDPKAVPIGGEATTGNWQLRVWTGEHDGVNELYHWGPRDSLASVVAINVTPPLAYGEVRYDQSFAGSLKPEAPYFVLDTSTDELRYASDAAAMTETCRKIGVTPAPLITPLAYYQAHRSVVVDCLAILVLLAVPVFVHIGLRRWTGKLVRHTERLSET